MASSEEVKEEKAEALEYMLREGLDSLPSRFLLPPDKRPVHGLLQQPTAQIPLIDLSQLHTPSRSLLLSQIHSACSHWGFFHVLNHGVSLDLLHSLRQGISDFLALPTAHKYAFGALRNDDGQGFGSAFVNPQIGAAEWRDYLLLRTFPEELRDYSNWPPMLKDLVAPFSAQVMCLARLLLSIFSENLRLPPSSVEDAMGVLRQRILISHYPPCPEPHLAVGAWEHTDVGTITCLWQVSEDVVGLQVRKDGQWHSVEPVNGAIVVNVADQVERFSNGVYKSGWHRVVLNNSKPRISVAVFLNPSADAVVSPAPSFVDSNHPALYEPVDFKTYATEYGIKAD